MSNHVEEAPAEAGLGRLASAVLGALALGLGVWLRVSNYDTVFAAGTVLPLTPDANYHLHRSLGAYAQFPSVPVFDRLMNWPIGAACHWSNGFDFISAALARVLAPGGDEYAAAGVIVFVPVLLGLLCAAMAAACAHCLCEGQQQRALSVQLTWWLGLLLPLGVFTSLLGRTDHHVAEALAVAALCRWALSRFPSAQFGAWPARRRWLFELEGALLIAGSMYLFDGSLLYLATAAAPLLLATLRERVRSRVHLAGSGAPAFALGATATAALYAPNMRAHGQLLSYAFPSLLQPALLIAAAGALLATYMAAVLVPHAGTRVPWRRLGALLVPCAAIGAGALLSPLRAPLFAAIEQHLLRGDPWLQQIEEFKPLLTWNTLFTAAGWSEACKYFGVFAPGTLVLLPFALHAARRTQPERAAAFAWFCACLVALSLLQERFARALWPVLAVWSACASVALARRVFGPRAGSGVAVLTTLAAALCGVFATGALHARVLPEHAPPNAGALASVFLAQANAPRADGTRAGVLTSWSLGHDMVWPAKSGVVANGFLFHVGREGLEQVQRALAGDEAGALALMEKRDLGWLVIGADYYAFARLGRARLPAIVLDDAGRGVINAAFLQRAPLAVSMLGGAGLPEAGVPHLHELVPRWVAPAALPNTAVVLPELWAFERVRGALLTGTTKPGARVTADVQLLVRGAALPYRAWVDSDPSGRFALRVPIWNGVLGEGLRTAAQWTVRLPDRAPIALTLSETDVRDGRELGIDAPPVAVP